MADLDKALAALPGRLVANIPVGSTDECWVYRGHVGPTGYARYGLSHGRPIYVHRLLFETVSGRSADGLVVDHLCRNTACVNPWHLEAVTQRVNVRRGNGLAAANARKTHCPSGHEYTDENTRPVKKKGRVVGRACRECERRRAREYKRKRRAAGG